MDFLPGPKEVVIVERWPIVEVQLQLSHEWSDDTRHSKREILSLELLFLSIHSFQFLFYLVISVKIFKLQSESTEAGFHSKET